MSSPLLWGPNNTASNLQNQVLQANGSLLAYDGAKNYISYGNFENSLTTGWSLGTIGTLTNGLPTGSPTFGSGASGNLSIATTSSANIEGLYSLQLISSAATTQGNMLASQAYSIDVEDQAKVMTVKFYYQATSGASNCNFSGTSSNSFAWAIYDVTNSSWLTSAGNFNLVQSSGCGYVTGTCQTNSNTSQLRLVVYNANATSGAATITLDGFYVGPQTAPSGPAMTDWVAYTPTFTGLGTPTGVLFYSRRVGDSLQVLGTFIPGSATATQAQITLGFNGTNNNVTIDSTKIGTNSLVGEAEQAVAASSYFGTTVLATGGNGYFLFGTKTSTSNGLSPSNGSVLSNGVAISFFATVPIAGWSSNSSMSSDTDTRVCAFQAYLASNYAAGANAAIKYDTVLNDTHAGYSTSTGLYTVPVSGYYRVSVIALTASSSGTPYLAKNGSAVGYFSVATSSSVNGGSQTVKCNAGDTLAAYSNASLTWGGSSAPYTNMISIDRLTGPAVVTASENVYLQYTGNGGQSITAITTDIPFSTKVIDSHGAWGGASFTAPRSGWYNVTGSVYATSTNNCQIYIYVGGVQTLDIGGSSAIVQSSWRFAGGTYLTAGQTLSIRADGNFTANNNGVIHHIEISSQ